MLGRTKPQKVYNFVWRSQVGASQSFQNLSLNIWDQQQFNKKFNNSFLFSSRYHVNLANLMTWDPVSLFYLFQFWTHGRHAAKSLSGVNVPGRWVWGPSPQVGDCDYHCWHQKLAAITCSHSAARNTQSHLCLNYIQLSPETNHFFFKHQR